MKGIPSSSQSKHNNTFLFNARYQSAKLETAPRSLRRYMIRQSHPPTISGSGDASAEKGPEWDSSKAFTSKRRQRSKSKNRQRQLRVSDHTQYVRRPADGGAGVPATNSHARAKISHTTVLGSEDASARTVVRINSDCAAVGRRHAQRCRKGHCGMKRADEYRVIPMENATPTCAFGQILFQPKGQGNTKVCHGMRGEMKSGWP